IDTVRKSIFDKIEKLQLGYSELEKELSVEKLKNTELTESDIIFFLSKLKNGNVDYVKYRKTLIDIFVKSIYLYDDKVTIIFNVDNISITIDDVILDKINKSSKNLNSNSSVVPNKGYEHYVRIFYFFISERCSIPRGESLIFDFITQNFY
ncbi:MAG: hypothetical protein K2N83_03700, partial [Eubacterium sp.]|nr:hypothetical protein [Eubacterium sp.]